MDAFLDPKTQRFIRYIDFPGVEPSVVFLGGLGIASTAVFPRVVFESGLSKRHSILVDVFGCGYSDSPENFSYSIEDHAFTLSGLLDQIGSKHYVLVGHSLGGAIAIELSSMRSDLVVQLVLAEANLFAGGGAFTRNIAKQTEINFVRSGYQELIDKCRSAALNGDNTSAITLGLWQVTAPQALYRGAVSAVKGTQPIMWDKLIQLSISRTFVFGSQSLKKNDDDRVLQKSLVEKNIHVAVVPNAGHRMMVENPEGFAAVIVEALERYN